MTTLVSRQVLHSACDTLFCELEANDLELNPLLLEACQKLEAFELSNMDFDRLTIGFIQIVHNIRVSKVNLQAKETDELMNKLTNCINLFKVYAGNPCGSLKAKMDELQKMYLSLQRYINETRQIALRQTTRQQVIAACA